MLAELRDLGVKKIIVQVVDPSPPYPPGVWKQQMAAALAAGFKVGYYIYLWNGTSFHDQFRIAADKVSLAGLAHSMCEAWADIEATDFEGWDKARIGQEITTLLREQPGIGVYTGKWWADVYTTTNYLLPVGTPLWVAEYDHKPNLDSFSPFWGINRPTMKQYEGDRVLASAARTVPNTGFSYGGQIDLNVYEEPPPKVPVLTEGQRASIIGRAYAHDAYNAYAERMATEWSNSPRGAGWVRLTVDAKLD